MLQSTISIYEVALSTPDIKGILHKPQEGFPECVDYCRQDNVLFVVEARVCFIQVISCPNLDSGMESHRTTILTPTGRIQDFNSVCE